MAFQCWLISSRRGTDVSPSLRLLQFPGPSGLSLSVLVLVEEVDDLLGCLDQHLHYFFVHVIGLL